MNIKKLISNNKNKIIIFILIIFFIISIYFVIFIFQQNTQTLENDSIIITEEENSTINQMYDDSQMLSSFNKVLNEMISLRSSNDKSLINKSSKGIKMDLSSIEKTELQINQKSFNNILEKGFCIFQKVLEEMKAKEWKNFSIKDLNFKIDLNNKTITVLPSPMTSENDFQSQKTFNFEVIDEDTRSDLIYLHFYPNFEIIINSDKLSNDIIKQMIIEKIQKYNGFNDISSEDVDINISELNKGNIAKISNITAKKNSLKIKNYANMRIKILK